MRRAGEESKQMASLQIILTPSAGSDINIDTLIWLVGSDGAKDGQIVIIGR